MFQKRIAIIAVILMTVFMVWIVGLFDPASIVCVEPNNSTSPDFEVVFGQFKLKKSTPEKYKTYSFDYSSIWTKHYRPTNSSEVGEGPYVHFINGNFVSKKREVKDSGRWNPQIQVKSAFKIHIYFVYLYFLVYFFLLIVLFYRIIVRK